MAEIPQDTPQSDLAARIAAAKAGVSAEGVLHKEAAQSSHAEGAGGKESAGREFSASRLGFEFSAAIVAGAGLGWVIDRFLGTGPLATLVLLLLGFIAGLMNVWRGLNGYGQTVGFRRQK